MRMKIITKRHGRADTLRDAATMQRTINRIRGRALIPRGIYRFASFAEADTWMTRTIAHTHARRNSKT